MNFSDPFGLCPYTGKKRDLNVDDCPKDKLGNAIRLISRFGGKQGAAVLGYLVANPSVRINVVSATDVEKRCGTEFRACLRGDQMVIPDASHGRMVEAIGHESFHGMNPGSECSTEVPAMNYGLDLYGTLPEGLQADAYDNALLRMRSQSSMYFDEVVRQRACR